MKIPFSQLPVEIQERLQDVQKNHNEYTGFYQSDGGKGWAIFGLIMAVLGVLGMLGIAFEERIGLMGWFFMTLFNVWLIVASIRHIKRYNASPIKPFIFLNPLYFTKVSATEVTYYNLWSDREDLNITHHHTNGVYTHTEFDFTFTNGAENLRVSPKAKAEELIDLIDEYRAHMLEAIASENFGSIADHDLFFELGENTPEQKQEKSAFSWSAWGMAAGAALMLSAGFYTINLYSIQGNALNRCETYRTSKYYGPIRCYDNYFKYYTPNVLTSRAQEGLFDAYKKKFENSSHSAAKVRDLMDETTFTHLTSDQNVKLKTYYATEGKKALKILYNQAIENFKRVTISANPAAKKAIIKLLEIAKNENKYVVQIKYNRKINATLNKRTFKTKSGRIIRIEPMAPSFVPRYNLLRENGITERVKKAFKKIIPEDILQFDIDGDLEFNITYSLRPYSVYTLTNKRTYTKRYYRGIRIFWDFKIISQGKLLYEYLDTTRPAKSFTVRRKSRYRRRYGRYRRHSRYGSRSSIPNATMYDKMAATTFDNYSRRILVHFGVKRPSYSDRKARKVWKLYKKLGILKELAAGKSFKDINLAAKLKAAGIKVPLRKKVNRRNRYRRNRYRRKRYRRKRYRRKRYRRKRYRRKRYRRRRYRHRRYRRRRPPRRRGSWLDK